MPRVLLVLSLAAMFIASLVARSSRTNLKRMFAYSSVAQIGYITLGPVARQPSRGLTGAIVHLFNHALTKGALFMLLGGIVLRIGGVALDCVCRAGRPHAAHHASASSSAA